MGLLRSNEQKAKKRAYRLKKKADKRAARQRRLKTRKQTKVDKIKARKSAKIHRQSQKTERVGLRQSGKSTRTTSRTGAKVEKTQIKADAGFYDDGPVKFGDVAEAVGGVAGMFAPDSGGEVMYVGGEEEEEDNTMLYVGIGGVALVGIAIALAVSGNNKGKK